VNIPPDPAYLPIKTEAAAQKLPEVAAIYAQAREQRRRGAFHDGNRTMLAGALEGAGVDLGGFDVRVMEWLCTWEPTTVAAVTGWIRRAAAGCAGGGDG
jgi:hypothetical protein